MILELSFLRSEVVEETERKISYGVIVYFMGFILNNLNPIKIEEQLVINHTFVTFDNFPFNEKSFIDALLEATTPSLLSERKEKYYRFIENFDIDINSFELINDGSLTIRKVNYTDVELYKKGHFYDNNNHIDKWKVVLESTSYDLLKDENIKYLVGLLRIFKCGDFRISLLYNLRQDILGNKTIERTENCYSNLSYTEPILNYAIVGSSREYTLSSSELQEFVYFYTKNIQRVRNYEFALECLNNISNIKVKFRIAILFFIIESFFELKDNEPIKHNLKILCTNLVNDDIKIEVGLFYKLRSGLSHGDEEEIDYALKKLLTKKSNEEDMFLEAYLRLYKITINVWKSILDLNITDSRKLVEEVRGIKYIKQQQK